MIARTIGLVAVALALALGAQAQVGKSETLLYPNQATKAELAALPGLNEALADKIIENRPYKDMLQLDKLLADALSAELRAELYKHLFEPLNLNAATEAEILLVPSVGKRMAHEFEEYRPYDSLARFRREIGKYVDNAMLDHFEQYVFVPLDLNTASEDDFKTIPGVGDRLAHEFVEYRPYQNIQQFRREIGKYVNEKEVARLERYVTIKQ